MCEGESSPHEHRMVLAFDTDDPEFIRGFELGMLWSILGVTPDDEPLPRVMVHSASAEMVMRIGDALHRPVRGFSPRDTSGCELDNWLIIDFAPAGA